jgi:hypothetical protein
VRYLGGNPYPRIVVTNRPSQREADWAYGPFASRAAAERFSEEALKLFLLRRCTDDLDPNPSHPGCVYSEMKMCLAPCYKGCTDERYGEEATAVRDFLATRGESKLVKLRTQREEASANLEFESAAALHAQVQRVEGVKALAPELVQPLSKLRAVILQPPAVGPTAPSAPAAEVSVFLFEQGRLRGPVGFSTVGMRIQNERSGSSSLFAQPMAIEGSPEQPPLGDLASQPAAGATLIETPAKAARSLLEARLDGVLTALSAPAEAPSSTVRQAHLALLKRWYYRPEVRRVGEICFPDAQGHWPLKSILRSVGRVAAKSLTGAKPE